jgi:hypothetical protein
VNGKAALYYVNYSSPELWLHCKQRRKSMNALTSDKEINKEGMRLFGSFHIMHGKAGQFSTGHHY